MFTTDQLQLCVGGSDGFTKTYSFLRPDQSKQNDIRQVISIMAAQEEMNCKKSNDGTHKGKKKKKKN